MNTRIFQNRFPDLKFEIAIDFDEIFFADTTCIYLGGLFFRIFFFDLQVLQKKLFHYGI